MTPDHGMEGQAPWNVLDLVDSMLAREHAIFLQNFAYLKLRNPEVTVVVPLHVFTFHVLQLRQCFGGLFKKLGGVMMCRSLTRVWLIMGADY